MRLQPRLLRLAPTGGSDLSESEAPLLFTRENGVARLTLNRPRAGNAIDVPLARALMEAAIECDEDAGIRCVLLTGAGKLFCAGGDISGFTSAGDKVPMLLKEITAYIHSAASRFSRMEKPMVTAINGAAAGAGLSFALLGDIAIAGASAHFTMAYTAIGLSPDGGATWLLPRLIGLRRAQEMTLLNKRVSAEEAVAIGLITRVVEDQALAAAADEVAAQLANSATRALGRSRNLLLSSYGNALEEQLELESRGIAAGGRDLEGKEGMAAFLMKRKPDFRAT
jgi:2-(1,2-epoxy-1,2-dihydrophenyl)acetyl-CoA isomerase